MAVHGTGNKLFDQAAATYSALINTEAAAGWQFVCFDSTTIHTTYCCQAHVTNIKLLVFSKEGSPEADTSGFKQSAVNRR